ncbi:MAG: hypothetical protein ACOX4U_07630 [Anaerovoracaceae bacterium]
MGEEYNRRAVHCDPCQVKCESFSNPCDCQGYGEREEEGWEWGSSLIILLVILFLCGGGSSLFGCGGDCCEGTPGGGFGSGSWLLIAIVIILLFQGQKGCKGGGFNLF